MATDKELLPDADDKGMFDAALNDAPVETPEVAEPEPSSEERPRDEHGRFKPKEAEQPQAEASPQQAEEKPVEKPAEAKPETTDAIPAWRLREEAEARRAAEDRFQQTQRQLQALQRQLAQQRPPEKLPDLMESPDAFVQTLERRLTTQIEQRYIRASLSRAGRSYGEEFQKAWGAFDSSGDEHLLERVKASDDPGEEIMAWYRERETLREIGSDPKAYRQRLLDEAMKDPEFRKRAMEAWRGEANGNGQTRPAPIVQLPSLSQAPGGGGNIDTQPTTDAELFQYATARR